MDVAKSTIAKKDVVSHESITMLKNHADKTTNIPTLRSTYLSERTSSSEKKYYYNGPHQKNAHYSMSMTKNMTTISEDLTEKSSTFIFGWENKPSKLESG